MTENKTTKAVFLGAIFISLAIIFTSVFFDYAIIDGSSFSNITLQTNSTIENLTVNNNLFGVPISFTKQTQKETPFNVLKSGTTYLRLRPDVLNEHSESSRNAQSIVTSTNIVGQIFRASQDNINAIYLTLESNDLTLIDNFETYLNSLELQSVWVASGNLATLETGIVYEGTQSMSLPGDSAGNSWTKTFTATDYTDYAFHFNSYFTKDYDKFKVSFFISDGNNSKSFDLAFNNKDQWLHFEVPEKGMTEDQVGITNMLAITSIGYIITDKDGGEFVYIDNINSVPYPDKLNIELYDMGATQPVSTITSINDGTQVTQLGDISYQTPFSTFTLDLRHGKSLYHIHDFITGVALEISTNQLLTKDNYYMIVLSYNDTNVTVYGANELFNYDYYNSGYAFTTPDKNTPINQIGTYNDLMFSIFSTQDTYLIGWKAITNTLAGEDSYYMNSIEDKNMKTIDVINSQGSYVGESGIFSLVERPMFAPKGSKFNLDYTADMDDSVNKVIFGARYVYEPPFVWG